MFERANDFLYELSLLFKEGDQNSKTEHCCFSQALYTGADRVLVY